MDEVSRDATAGQGRAWITGAAGLIGSCLARLAARHALPFKIIPLARADLDLTDFAAVERRFLAERPGLVIHCAALSKTPDCQAHPALARRINVEATALLAALAAEADFIFFSTDLVFDGTKGNYVETDPVNPLSVYAETKAAAESIVLKQPTPCHRAHLLEQRRFPRRPAAPTTSSSAPPGRKEKPSIFSTTNFAPPSPPPPPPAPFGNWPPIRRGGLWHLAGSERLSRLQIGRLLAARHPELRARIESFFPARLSRRPASRRHFPQLRQTASSASPSPSPA